MKNIRFREEIPEGLHEAGKELPFGVPDHYFDDFQARLQVRLDRKKMPAMSRNSLFVRYMKPALGLAAAFAAVFLLVYVPVQVVTRTNTFAQNKPASDEDKIINLVEQVDDHTFFNLLEDENKDEVVEGQELEVFIASNYSDFDIYLETKK
jgi:hypothetical protein